MNAEKSALGDDPWRHGGRIKHPNLIDLERIKLGGVIRPVKVKF